MNVLDRRILKYYNMTPNHASGSGVSLANDDIDGVVYQL